MFSVRSTLVGKFLVGAFLLTSPYNAGATGCRQISIHAVAF